MQTLRKLSFAHFEHVSSRIFMYVVLTLQLVSKISLIGTAEVAKLQTGLK